MRFISSGTKHSSDSDSSDYYSITFDPLSTKDTPLFKFCVFTANFQNLVEDEIPLTFDCQGIPFFDFSNDDDYFIIEHTDDAGQKHFKSDFKFADPVKVVDDLNHFLANLIRDGYIENLDFHGIENDIMRERFSSFSEFDQNTPDWFCDQEVIEKEDWLEDCISKAFDNSPDDMFFYPTVKFGDITLVSIMFLEQCNYRFAFYDEKFDEFIGTFDVEYYHDFSVICEFPSEVREDEPVRTMRKLQFRDVGVLTFRKKESYFADMIKISALTGGKNNSGFFNKHTKGQTIRLPFHTSFASAIHRIVDC